MRINKIYFALGALIALALFLELTAHADEFNEATTITFSAPVQIPGQVLPAGTYLFQQADPARPIDVQAERDLVSEHDPRRTVHVRLGSRCRIRHCDSPDQPHCEKRG